MATDFFERQSSARRSTAWLVTMFVLAVIAIMASVAGLAYTVFLSQSKDLTYHDDPSVFLVPTIAAGATLLLIVGGSLYKVFELRRGGGTLVAERLGGRRIYPNTAVSTERLLLNVVEEMAIASGTPVPPVFLLDDPGINAFAAGYSPSDAVLGVTRGCAEKLTRDELQGVIAHEFSHVLNGDMRMNIRLIGILHGILLLGLAGHMVLRSLFYAGHGRRRSSSGRDKGGGILILLAIAVGLIAIGFIGTFFGNLIKAAVSRQREYLADASAVQFTRNPTGLAGALKRIGGAAAGSQIGSANAREASHMFFSAALRTGIAGLWATHPPLGKRIRAIDPQWDGKFPVTDTTPVAHSSDGLSAALVGDAQPASAGGVPADVVDHAVDQVGEPAITHQHYAVKLIRELPQPILDLARDPYGARAILFCLLLDRRETIREQQLRVLEANAEKDVVLLTRNRAAAIDALDVRSRLPLVDLALPALRAISERQYRAFAKCFIALVNADKQINLFEWMLAHVLMRHLQPQFEPVRSPRIQYYGLQRLGDPCSVLLSAVAYADKSDEAARQAFTKAAAQLPELKLTLRSRDASSLSQLVAALKTLVQVAAKQRGRLVDACATAICADQQVSWQEAELLRGIADLLDCPMPPLLTANRVAVADKP